MECQLGVTYKTAWRMAHELHRLMDGLDVKGLFGDIEADETYIEVSIRAEEGEWCA